MKIQHRIFGSKYIFSTNYRKLTKWDDADLSFWCGQPKQTVVQLHITPTIKVKNDQDQIVADLAYSLTVL